MNNIPNTFCPAKWDELLVNLTNNYVYSCCKAKPIEFLDKKDITSVLDTQKHNLLSGVQDSSCNYCWLVEEQGYKSLRHEYLDQFDNNTIDQYLGNSATPKLIEINIGNECNFQCTYCNPKFSSQWEHDIREKEYKIFSDKSFYSLNEQKNKNIVDESIEWLQHQKPDILRIIGGEPLLSKSFFKIVNNVSSNILVLATNLSCAKETIDKVLSLADNYKEIYLMISIDSTKEIAEFTRYGMNYTRLLENIDYVFENLPKNVRIRFLSLMTSITVRDFNNTVDLIDNYYKQNKQQVDWVISSTTDPKIFTFATLHDKYKPNVLEIINKIKNRTYIEGLGTLEGAIKQSKFNKTLYGQMKHFLEEFSTRKNIDIPVIIE